MHETLTFGWFGEAFMGSGLLVDAMAPLGRGVGLGES